MGGAGLIWWADRVNPIHAQVAGVNPGGLKAAQPYNIDLSFGRSCD